MQSFLERYPAFKSHSLNVSKHVALMSELAKLVEHFQLLDISQLEQELACSPDDHSQHLRDLTEKLNNPKVKEMDKIRLAILYILRYEQQANLNGLKDILRMNGVSNNNIILLDCVLRF